MRIPLLRRRLDSWNARRIAEIGPGQGDLAAVLLSDQSRELVLYEISAAAADYLEARFSSSRVRIERHGMTPDGEGHFDAVVICEVLEHIADDLAVLRTIYSRLCPGGHVVGSVPAFMDKWNEGDIFAGHVRRYEREELERKLGKAGFLEIEILTFGFPLTTLIDPLRRLHYRSRNRKEPLQLQAATERSGIDRPRAPDWLVQTVRVATLCLQPIQALAHDTTWGDGFVFAATRPTRGRSSVSMAD